MLDALLACVIWNSKGNSGRSRDLPERLHANADQFNRAVKRMKVKAKVMKRKGKTNRKKMHQLPMFNNHPLKTKEQAKNSKMVVIRLHQLRFKSLEYLDNHQL